MSGPRNAAPPKGDVVYLFTDLEGSTALWEAYPEAMGAALARHDELLRAGIEAHRGFVFNIVGDAFHAAFAHARDGLLAAIEVQQALYAEPWSRFGDAFPDIRVRMALHNGVATWRDGDYYGPELNRVARLEAAGHGGQILVSGATRQRLEDRMPDGVQLRDLGEHRLKDLRHSEHIAQVVAEGLPDVTKSIRTAGELTPRDRIVIVPDAAPASSSGTDAGHDGETSRERETEDASPGTARSSGTAVTRTVEETLAAVRSAVCDEAHEVAFTADQLAEASRHHVSDLDAYRLARIAEWSQERYRLDGRFVGLTLLLDQGEDALVGRWQPAADRFGDVRDVLEETPEPAIVVLGMPGAGKSTLLRRLELDLSIAAIRGDDDRDGVTLLAPLNRYGVGGDGRLPDPVEWLSDEWRRHGHALPDLSGLMREGRVTFLLDGLNEMPAADGAGRRDAVERWRAFVGEMAAGNNAVFTCRSLDYSAPLSTSEMRVPQVRIEPLSDDQVRAFLSIHGPHRWRKLWSELDGTPELDVLRTPYFLLLLIQHADAEGGVSSGPAALFSGFVREALRRELVRGNPWLGTDRLLSARDAKRLLTARSWRSPYDLPERGTLVPGLCALACHMQARRSGGEQSQVRLDYDDALDQLPEDDGEAILSAGMDISVLDEDAGRDEIMFQHQLLQEYFAARRFAREPDPGLVRVRWRADEAEPSLGEAMAQLQPADALPGLPSSGWEETVVLAAPMSADPVDFLSTVGDANPALGGRCACQPDVLARLPDGFVADLAARMVALAEDPSTDLRYRIELGLRIGELGDPRFDLREGPHGAYLAPPMRAVGGLELGRFAVTNAEWRYFVASGGYDSDEWWKGPDARAWRRGENTEGGQHQNWRAWRDTFRSDPSRLDSLDREGRMLPEAPDLWRELVAMDDESFDAAMHERFPSRRYREPRAWDEAWAAHGHASYPVTGISRYEADAYCVWLSAQTGESYRLPDESEWERAARGAEGRRFAYGDTFDPQAGNVRDTHVRGPSPIGVFPTGRTPEGLDDMTGNTFDWTASSQGSHHAVARGGSFPDDSVYASATYRYLIHPSLRHLTIGLRLARDVR